MSLVNMIDIHQLKQGEY